MIAKAGKPMVRVVPITATSAAARRLGFMAGQGVIDADVKLGFEADMGDMFDPAR